MRLILIAVLASFILLSGALGLRASIAECQGDPDVNARGASGLMPCYHTAAMTNAYLGDATTARNICQQIYNTFGTGSQTDSQRDQAELISNTCLFDVARIMRDPSICGYITQNNDFGSQLFGSQVTKDTCYDEVTRLAQLAPENYYTNNPNNICSIVYIMPFLVIGSILYSKN